MDAYEEETLDNGDTRIVMHLKPSIAPYQVAILPLSKKLGEQAKEVLDKVNHRFSAIYDETGSIGKRYRRQDEIGTPFCVCVDFQTEEDKMVTVRDRDTMEQKRVAIEDLNRYLDSIINVD